MKNEQADRVTWERGAQSDGSPVDNINHPAHYKRGGMEVIDVIEAFSCGFCLGNVLKYCLRAGHKGDRLEDLEKAAWYLAREIANEKTARDARGKQ